MTRPPDQQRKPVPCCGPAAADEVLPLADEQADGQLAEFAKAVGHPVRVQILRILAAQNSCISGQIASKFNLAQSTVSQHLKILKDSGLIRGDIDGPRVCYCINPAAWRRFKALVAVL